MRDKHRYEVSSVLSVEFSDAAFMFERLKKNVIDERENGGLVRVEWLTPCMNKRGKHYITSITYFTKSIHAVVLMTNFRSVDDEAFRIEAETFSKKVQMNKTSTLIRSVLLIHRSMTKLIKIKSKRQKKVHVRSGVALVWDGPLESSYIQILLAVLTLQSLTSCSFF